ncbi:MAG: sialidase family protein [Candidatus Acidiferrales bacterium]
MTTRFGLRTAAVTLVLGVATLASAVRAQQVPAALPAAPGAKVVTLNRRPGQFSEPSVAINPQNPKQILTAFQVPASVAYSEDAGENWQLATATAPTDYKASGDVSVAYDILGHAFLCYIAFDKLGTAKYWAHGATRNGVFIRRSLDGGKTWDTSAIPVDAQPTHADMPFEDKPYLVADNNPDSPYAGSLYVGWTEFSLTKSVILFSRSKDGGIDWSAPYEISTHEGLPRDDNGDVEGFAAAAGPNGGLYAVWSDGDSIVLAASQDGGITFSPSRPILSVAPSYFKLTGVERSDGFPQIAVDPHSGRLFVTWSDYRNGDVDVFCSTSSDRGDTWSAAVRVNNDALHNGADQFLQWLAIDPADGSADVIFYDRRNDPENRRAIVVLARSTDSGRSFANYSWETDAFDPGDAFIGDYTGIAASNGRVYGAWTEAVAAPRTARSRPAATSGYSTVVKVAVADFQTLPLH